MAICYFRTPWRTPILRFLGAPIPPVVRHRRSCLMGQILIIFSHQPEEVPEDRAEVQAHARLLADALRPRNLHRVLVPALKCLLTAAFVPGIAAAMIVASVRSNAYHSALACKQRQLNGTSSITNGFYPL